MSVLTYHNDLSRTGLNLKETELTPSSVSSGQFGRLFSYPVDGQIYAQPLYMPGVIVPGKGIHNIIFVVTEHDSAYAFDADNHLSAPLWHTSFIRPSEGVSSVSAAELGCAAIAPEVGITATPVIDSFTGTLYVVAMTEERPNGQYVHRLHALDVTTGAERPGSPVEIQASAPGTGDGNTVVRFEPWLYKERAGLLLLNGTVYTAWSSQCDSGNYHGWILAYDAATLRQTAVFTSTPNWDAGAFWQSGAAPAADSSGNIYIVAANGTFDANRGGSDFAESVLKLSSKNLTVADYFTPYNAGVLSDRDLDLGSSGALLLPNETGNAAHPHLLVTGSKPGTVYLVDRENLGHFNPDGDTQIVQALSDVVGPLFGIPAYFNHMLYFSAATDQIKAFSIGGGLMSPAPVTASSSTFAAPGTVPVISSHGTEDGILWTVDSAAQLHAFDAADLGHQLYQESVGSFIKFSTPTVANGKVYVGTFDRLTVFGLQNAMPPSITAIVNSDGFRAEPVAPGSFITVFGSSLAPGDVASSSRWPEVLDGVSVFINGIAVPVGYVSPTQINAQVPMGTKPGPAIVTVVSGNRVLPPVELTVRNPFHVK